MIDIPDFVYPKDNAGNPLCPKCGKLVRICDCPVLESPKPKAPKIKPKIRLDKSGRKGKVVTLIEGLQANEEQLKELAKELKMKTGSGGTSYIWEGVGTIEVQGDHKALFEKYFRN